MAHVLEPGGVPDASTVSAIAGIACEVMRSFLIASAHLADARSAAGYTSLEELLAVDKKELLALHGVGPRATLRIRPAAPGHAGDLRSSTSETGSYVK
jgi:hypothetical protein